ncbi:hypothetical protein TNCV_1781821 [Trichonephila clavipes]|nr:hypothetical protein TNCV_1781821 [Trichonephila clavipes]
MSVRSEGRHLSGQLSLHARGKALGLNRFNAHRPLYYMVELQWHKSSNSRHSCHEFVTITIKLRQPHKEDRGHPGIPEFGRLQ